MSRPTAVVVALSIALSVGALTACSSSGDSGSSKSSPAAGHASSSSSGDAVDAAALVSSATRSTNALKSAHISSTTVLAGKTSTISGQVGYKPTRMDITIDAAGQKLREILVGNTFYIKVPAAAAAGKAWFSVSIAKISSLTGIDLDSLLSNASADQTVQLLSKSSNLKYVGTENVNGVHARHLSGTVDVSKYFDTLTSTEQSKQKQLKSLVDSLGMKNNLIDLWVNDQNIPVKVVQSYDSNQGHGTSTMVLTDLNAPVTVTAPPASQVGQLPG